MTTRELILNSRKLDLSELSRKELIQRSRRNSAKLAAVFLWLYDSVSWMEAATVMDDRSGRRETKGECVNDSHLNVAHVAAGYAYELAIKSIAKSDDVLTKPTHSVRESYGNLVNFNLKLLTFFNLKLRTFGEVASRLERDLPRVFCPRCQTAAGSVATGDRLATRGESEPIMTLGSGGCPRPDPGVRRAADPGDGAFGNCCRGC